MHTEIQLKRTDVTTALEKVWGKLTSKSQDFGDDLHYWEWTPGVGMYGVIKAYEGTKQERFATFIKQWAVDNSSKIKFGSVNWVVPANVLHSAYQQTGHIGYLKSCQEVADWCVHRALLTSNGGFAHVWGEGAGGLDDYKNQLWIDTLFMAGVFMLRFGLADQNEACIAEALKQFDIHIECQFDREYNLFYHGYHCLDGNTLGEHWGRGNGWAAVSLVELLGLLQDHPYEISGYGEIFQRQMESVFELRRDEDGMLRTLLREKTSYLETSASALFAYAALKGQRLGILDDKFRIWGEQMVYEIITHHLSDEGAVLHASGGTDCQEKEGYLKVPYQIRQYTNGIMLMLLTEVLEPDREATSKTI
ncbi:hypothetical protein GC096_02145 [Paenibacillus sp. LMG 31461]|uniref:Glycosyl hydrolase, family 88 n=1 Tax=Paenibacillus plantarum TaxID=2654975 RepID=A0ABX1X363_9BACL|nr:glycoside hydrolase family 88 protein [Paenibacillus plantarum]NOU62848.1 hypothetical protein [Paenibacillus plantarum]